MTLYVAIAIFLAAVITGAVLQYVMFTDYRDAATKSD